MPAAPAVIGTADPRRYPGRPLIGVSALIARDREVLLVRRAKPPCVWSLPGGLVEVGETLAEAARREVKEETGLDVAIERLATVLDVIRPDGEGRIERHFVLVVFAATLRGGLLEAGDDAAEAEWVAVDALGGREMTPGTAELVGRMMRGETLL